MKTATITVRLTFIESILGTSPTNEEIYREYIGSKSPDAKSVEDEVEALGAEAVADKGMTVFPRENEAPFLYDYQIKGFFKDTCGALKKVPGTQSAGIKAFKKEIDKLIFPYPRKIMIDNYGTIGECQRPLRASTAQGDRVTLAISEEIPAGAQVTFTVTALTESYIDVLREWFDYGVYSGIGQWRNSGHGRFYWEELNEKGEVIGGTKPVVAA